MLRAPCIEPTHEGVHGFFFFFLYRENDRDIGLRLLYDDGRTEVVGRITTQHCAETSFSDEENLRYICISIVDGIVKGLEFETDKSTPVGRQGERCSVANNGMWPNRFHPVIFLTQTLGYYVVVL